MAKKGRLRDALARHLKGEAKKKPVAVKSQAAKKESVQSDRVTVHVLRSKSRAVHASRVPFSPHSRVLLIGEGDFGFARCLAERYGLPSLIATGYDASRDAVVEKYPLTAPQNLSLLESKGITVLHGIDATQLHTSRTLLSAIQRVWNGMGPTRIVFNFPHTGSGIKDRQKNIQREQAFLCSFFQSVSLLTSAFAAGSKATRETVMMTREAADKASANVEYLNQRVKDDDDCAIDGSSVQEQPELLVTLKDGDPYDDWQVKRIAGKLPALNFAHSFAFDPRCNNSAASLYAPLYRHQRTLGHVNNPADDFEARGRTFAWRICHDNHA